MDVLLLVVVFLPFILRNGSAFRTQFSSPKRPWGRCCRLHPHAAGLASPRAETFSGMTKRNSGCLVVRSAPSSLHARTSHGEDYLHDVADDEMQHPAAHEGDQRRRRQERTASPMSNGWESFLVPRTVPIVPDWNITVWEWKHTARTVNDYWEEEHGRGQATPGHDDDDDLASPPSSAASDFGFEEQERRALLDPFGLVCWPGSVRAAQELHEHAQKAVRNRSVTILGAGVGVEAQAAAILGAKSVVATDVHPTTLGQLMYGVNREDRIIDKDVVRCRMLDVADHRQPLPPPPCDLLVVADVLYNERLATQVCRRCAEALEANPDVRILITDSQRFVPTFVDELNDTLEAAWNGAASSPSPSHGFIRPWQPVKWQAENLMRFTGSGVIIEEDQTYDVRVKTLWVGPNMNYSERF
jgi:predicted nicotinamide N-methyase